MMAIDEARANLCDAVTAVTETEWVALDEAFGRTLAETLKATCDVPPRANSAMDGYALFASAPLAAGNWFRLSQTVPAGVAPPPLAPGTAARILTGAVLPQGANAVVMQEQVTREGERICLKAPVNAGDNVRPQGQDITTGTLLARSGEVITPVLAGLLAATGVARVEVYRRVKVALLNTGRELVEPGFPLAPGQIYNSNRFMLAAQLQQANVAVTRSATLPDEHATTVSALLATAADVDLVITSGGVSVGDEDHVKAAIEQCGSLTLWKVQMKPGKPLAFGFVEHSTGRTPVLALPGNPVSAFVTFVLFGLALLQRLQGRLPHAPEPLPLPADFTLERATTRPEYLRVRVQQGKLLRYPQQSSGVLSSLHWATGLAYLPANTLVKRGDRLDYYPLSAWD